MVLDEIDKGCRWLAGTVDAALLAGLRRDFALIGKAFGQNAGDEFCRVIGEVAVIGMGLVGCQNMGGVMEIVVPFGGE